MNCGHSQLLLRIKSRHFPYIPYILSGYPLLFHSISNQIFYKQTGRSVYVFQTLDPVCSSSFVCLPPQFKFVKNETYKYHSCINRAASLFSFFILLHKSDMSRHFFLDIPALQRYTAHIAEDKEVPATRPEFLCPFLFEGTRGVACNVVHQGRYHPQGKGR